jgi:hypothetical protein
MGFTEIGCEVWANCIEVKICLQWQISFNMIKDFLTLEDGIDIFSLKVSKELPLDAA